MFSTHIGLFREKGRGTSKLKEQFSMRYISAVKISFLFYVFACSYCFFFHLLLLLIVIFDFSVKSTTIFTILFYVNTHLSRTPIILVGLLQYDSCNRCASTFVFISIRFSLALSLSDYEKLTFFFVCWLLFCM